MNNTIRGVITLDSQFNKDWISLCGGCQSPINISDKGTIFFVSSNVGQFKGQLFPVSKCTQCQSLTSLMVMDFKKMYEKYPVKNRKLDFFSKPSFNKLLSRLSSAGLKKSDRILDFGCGNGIFLNYLNSKGYQNTAGFDPYCEPFHEKPLGQFDFILANDVMEHLTDPRILLRFMKTYLKPNGVGYIGVPCTDFLNLNDRGSHMTILHQPYHRVILSKKQLFKITLEEKFCIKKIYHRSYLDTFYPFVNYRFLDELLIALGHDMDRAFSPIPLMIWIRNPRLWFAAIFGSLFPASDEPGIVIQNL